MSFWLAAVLALTACQAGPRNFENENDRLRRANQQLEADVRELEQELARREAETRRLAEQFEDAGRPSADTPRATRIEFGRYTGPIDTDDDGRDDTVRVYVQPLDQQGRFIPVRAEARLRLVALPPDEDPYVVEDRNWSADEFAQCYRSGLTGTHYTLESPLDPPEDAPERMLIVVDLHDQSTGVTLTLEQPITLQRSS